MRHNQEAILAEIDTIDYVPWINAAVFFVATLVLGNAIWKALIIAALVLAASTAHYGRRILTKLGTLVLIGMLIFWSGAMPVVGEWPKIIHAFAAAFTS